MEFSTEFRLRHGIYVLVWVFYFWCWILIRAGCPWPQNILFDQNRWLRCTKKCRISVYLEVWNATTRVAGVSGQHITDVQDTWCAVDVQMSPKSAFIEIESVVKWGHFFLCFAMFSEFKVRNSESCWNRRWFVNGCVMFCTQCSFCQCCSQFRGAGLWKAFCRRAVKCHWRIQSFVCATGQKDDVAVPQRPLQVLISFQKAGLETHL